MAEVKTTCREELLAKLREDPVWDVVVIGGGAPRARHWGGPPPPRHKTRLGEAPGI